MIGYNFNPAMPIAQPNGPVRTAITHSFWIELAGIEVDRLAEGVLLLPFLIRRYASNAGVARRVAYTYLDRDNATLYRALRRRNIGLIAVDDARGGLGTGIQRFANETLVASLATALKTEAPYYANDASCAVASGRWVGAPYKVVGFRSRTLTPEEYRPNVRAFIFDTFPWTSLDTVIDSFWRSPRGKQHEGALTVTANFFRMARQLAARGERSMWVATGTQRNTAIQRQVLFGDSLILRYEALEGLFRNAPPRFTDYFREAPTRPVPVDMREFWTSTNTLLAKVAAANKRDVGKWEKVLRLAAFRG